MIAHKGGAMQSLLEACKQLQHQTDDLIQVGVGAAAANGVRWRQGCLLVPVAHGVLGRLRGQRKLARCRTIADGLPCCCTLRGAGPAATAAAAGVAGDTRCLHRSQGEWPCRRLTGAALGACWMSLNPVERVTAPRPLHCRLKVSIIKTSSHALRCAVATYPHQAACGSRGYSYG